MCSSSGTSTTSSPLGAFNSKRSSQPLRGPLRSPAAGFGSGRSQRRCAGGGSRRVRGPGEVGAAGGHVAHRGARGERGSERGTEGGGDRRGGRKHGDEARGHAGGHKCDARRACRAGSKSCFWTLLGMKSRSFVDLSYIPYISCMSIVTDFPI